MKKALLAFTLCLVLLPLGSSAQPKEPSSAEGASIFELSGLRDCLVGVVEHEGDENTPRTYKVTPGSCTVEQIIPFINGIIKWGLGISGAAALLLYVMGGTWMIFSAGDSARLSKGKDIIIGTTMALGVIFTSYILVDFTLRALTGQPTSDGSTAAVTSCAQQQDGVDCGDNEVCFNQQCVTECAFVKARTETDPTKKWQCQFPSNPSRCETGLCPSGNDNVCCY